MTKNHAVTLANTHVARTTTKDTSNQNKAPSGLGHIEDQVAKHLDYKSTATIRPTKTNETFSEEKIVSSSADKSHQDYQKTEGKLNVGVIKFSGISIDGSAIEGASINGEDCGSG